MAEMLFNWVTEHFDSSNIIDLYFVVSDLIEIPLTETERYQTAYFDAYATHTSDGGISSNEVNIPLGKQVW